MSAEMNLRAKAARIAGQAEIRDVRTKALHADMEFPPPPGSRLGYYMDAEFEYARAEEHGDFTVVQGVYNLNLWIAADDDDSEETERQEFATLSFTLVGLFDVPGPQDNSEPYADEEWEAFVQTSAQFALYPYARETIGMLTTRLGVPPLTVGVLRIGLDRDEVKALADEA